jgi:hypothetical protein
VTDRSIEERLREVEDRLAIYQLIATYGPAVDSQSKELVGSLWTEDGFYETIFRMEGRAEVERMVVTDPHASLVANGVGHVQAMPHVTIDGDTAVATLHTILFLRDEPADGFRVWRVAASRWELVREPDGWRITGRTNKLLDGTDEAKELFRRGFDEPRA